MSGPDPDQHVDEIFGNLDETRKRIAISQLRKKIESPVSMIPLEAAFRDFKRRGLVSYKEGDFLDKLVYIVDALHEIDPRFLTQNYSLISSITDAMKTCLNDKSLDACMGSKWTLERELSVAEGQLFTRENLPQPQPRTIQMGKGMNIKTFVLVYDEILAKKDTEYKRKIIDAGRTYLSICENCPYKSLQKDS